MKDHRNHLPNLTQFPRLKTHQFRKWTVFILKPRDHMYLMFCCTSNCCHLLASLSLSQDHTQMLQPEAVQQFYFSNSNYKSWFSKEVLKNSFTFVEGGCMKMLGQIWEYFWSIQSFILLYKSLFSLYKQKGIFHRLTNKGCVSHQHYYDVYYYCVHICTCALACVSNQWVS